MGNPQTEFSNYASLFFLLDLRSSKRYLPFLTFRQMHEGLIFQRAVFNVRHCNVAFRRMILVHDKIRTICVVFEKVRISFGKYLGMMNQLHILLGITNVVRLNFQSGKCLEFQLDFVSTNDQQNEVVYPHKFVGYIIFLICVYTSNNGNSSAVNSIGKSEFYCVLRRV